jgi:hypothetical protein
VKRFIVGLIGVVALLVELLIFVYPAEALYTHIYGTSGTSAQNGTTGTSAQTIPRCPPGQFQLSGGRMCYFVSTTPQIELKISLMLQILFCSALAIPVILLTSGSIQ